jgi:DNA-binding FrmR family transcriptional regulator
MSSEQLQHDRLTDAVQRLSALETRLETIEGQLKGLLAEQLATLTNVERAIEGIQAQLIEAGIKARTKPKAPKRIPPEQQPDPDSNRL